MSFVAANYAKIYLLAPVLNDVALKLSYGNGSVENLNSLVSNEDFAENVTILQIPETVNHSISERNVVRRISPEIPIWLIPCYSIILLCAVVGNLLVISTLVQNRRMRTITNVFLLNLAISDILLGVLCMPVTLVGTLLRHFIFGEFLCKLISFSQAISVAVSSWTLVAISCERYYAICHPLRSRTWQTLSHAYKIIGFIWIGSIICMTPIAGFSRLMPTSRQGFRKCREHWPENSLVYERSYNILLDMLLLVLPLLTLCVAYILITRTLYVGMQNERALIFGGSSSRKLKQQIHEDSSLNLNNMEPTSLINMRCYTDKLNDKILSKQSCSHSLNGARSDGATNTNTVLLETLQQSSSQDAHHNSKLSKRFPKKQSNYKHMCYDDAVNCTQGNKRMLLTTPTGRSHLYCMRTSSLKVRNHASVSTAYVGSSSVGAATTSMTVINMPQQQCFQLQQQRQLQYHEKYEHSSISSTSLRLADTTLRRSNEAKTLESKRRVIKMLFVLVLEFFICWTPLYVINTMAIFIGSAMYEYIDYTSISFLQLLAYSSSCCNPITYCFMNAGFRRSFLDTFKGIPWRDGNFWRQRRKQDQNLSMAGNSITLANSVTIMSNNILLDSPRL